MTRPRQASWKVAEPGFQLGWSCPKLPLHRFLGWANKIRTFTQIWSAGSPFVRSEWIRFKGGLSVFWGAPSSPLLSCGWSSTAIPTALEWQVPFGWRAPEVN